MFRTCSRVLACAAIAAALSFGGSALSAGAAVSPSMVGGGVQFGPGTMSSFSVSARGTTTSASGSITTATFHATVTCLQVSGNDGIATAVIDSSTDPNNPPGEIIVGEGVDNGNPSGGTSPDLWRISFNNNGGIFPSGQGSCYLPVNSPVPIVSGNIVVSD